MNYNILIKIFPQDNFIKYMMNSHNTAIDFIYLFIHLLIPGVTTKILVDSKPLLMSKFTFY